MNTCKGKLTRTPITPNEMAWTNPCPFTKDGITVQFESLPTELGQGSFGTVFEATCGENKDFAVKWIQHISKSQVIKEITLQNAVAPYFAKPIYER